jgi:predicted MFS family arabinose efflux permease
LLRRSSHSEDRPALFAAQFALSHACWLLTYPLAGWLGAKAGLPLTFVVLAVVAALATVLAEWLWPANDPKEIEHTHPGMKATHPHAAGTRPIGDGVRHRHAYVIDSHHPEWPASH